MIFCQKNATQVVDWAIANPEGQVAYYVLLKATPEWASFLELQSFENHVREPISVTVLFCLLIWIFSI